MTADIDEVGSSLAYPRVAVDDFKAAAAQERARLEATIADAEARARRARAAIGMHRVMVSMLLETQRELSGIREDAELQAATMIEAAESKAQDLVARARDDARPMHDLGAASAASTWMRAQTSGPEIDLVEEESNGVTRSQQSSAPPPPVARELDGAGADGYLSYLRGALHDDQPLGPAIA